MSKAILVLGATGTQGGAVVDALLADPASKGYTILAVTRDANGGSAKKLEAKSPSIKIVQGDVDHADALLTEGIKAAGGSLYAVFSLQGAGDAEERQGKAVVDAVLKNKIPLLVYASVERGGDELSWSNPTPVPHFIAKHNIEQYLRKNAEGTSTDWSIIRPVAFMDNWTPSPKQTAFATAIRDTLSGGKKLQLTSAIDIGYFASQHLLHPEEFSKSAHAIAGDEVSLAEIRQAFEEVKGQPYDKLFNVGPDPILPRIKGSDFGYMIDWFRTDGYGADIPALKKRNPGLLNLKEWLKQNTSIQPRQ